MNDHKFPDWFRHYADQFVPKNRCTYCWWVRGGIAHAIIWDILVSMLLWLCPPVAWFLRGVMVTTIILLQRYDNYNRELKNASGQENRSVSDTRTDDSEQGG